MVQFGGRIVKVITSKTIGGRIVKVISSKTNYLEDKNVY